MDTQELKDFAYDRAREDILSDDPETKARGYFDRGIMISFGDVLGEAINAAGPEIAMRVALLTVGTLTATLLEMYIRDDDTPEARDEMQRSLMEAMSNHITNLRSDDLTYAEQVAIVKAAVRAAGGKG